MKHLLTLLTLLLFSLPAWAGETVDAKSLSNGCFQYTLCSAEAGTGDCADAAGDIYVATFINGYTHTLFAEESTATSFTCALRMARDAWSATIYGSTNPAITVTEAVEVQPFDGMIGKFWSNCSAVADNQVTIYALSCPLSK